MSDDRKSYLNCCTSSTVCIIWCLTATSFMMVSLVLLIVELATEWESAQACVVHRGISAWVMIFAVTTLTLVFRSRIKTKKSMFCFVACVLLIVGIIAAVFARINTVCSVCSVEQDKVIALLTAINIIMMVSGYCLLRTIITSEVATNVQ